MRKPKSLPDKRRRLTQREESAVALIALRMVIAEREWNPGDAPVVRMLDMMFRVLEYQIAAKAFGAWLTRLGIQTLRRGGRKLVVVPVSFDEAESVLRKLTGAGHTLATAVKVQILEQAYKLAQSGDNAGCRLRLDGSGDRSQHQDPLRGEAGSGTAGNGLAGRGTATQGEANQDSLEGGDATVPNRESVTRGPHAAPAEPRKPLNDFLDEEED